MGNVKIIVALRAILINKFQFAESAAQILRRNNQRTTFCKIQTIFMENPLKSRDFSGFSGPSDWFRASGLVVPNMNRKLFLDVSDDFSSFLLVFRYYRDIFGAPISACSARVCSNPCGQKRFPLKRTGSVSAFIICPYPKKYWFISETLPSLSQNHS